MAVRGSGRWRSRRPRDWLAPEGAWPAGPFLGGVPWEVVAFAQMVMSMSARALVGGWALPELATATAVPLGRLRACAVGVAAPTVEEATQVARVLECDIFPSVEALRTWQVARVPVAHMPVAHMPSPGSDPSANAGDSRAGSIVAALAGTSYLEEIFAAGGVAVGVDDEGWLVEYRPGEPPLVLGALAPDGSVRWLPGADPRTRRGLGTG